MEEEDLSPRRPFGVFNLQTFQPLKAKSNPNQATQKANRGMEEEDLPFQTPFFLQSANKPSPKNQKQPKPSLTKCNCNPSSSITQKIKFSPKTRFNFSYSALVNDRFYMQSQFLFLSICFYEESGWKEKLRF